MTVHLVLKSFPQNKLWIMIPEMKSIAPKIATNYSGADLFAFGEINGEELTSLMSFVDSNHYGERELIVDR